MFYSTTLYKVFEQIITDPQQKTHFLLDFFLEGGVAVKGGGGGAARGGGNPPGAVSGGGGGSAARGGGGGAASGYASAEIKPLAISSSRLGRALSFSDNFDFTFVFFSFAIGTMGEGGASGGGNEGAAPARGCGGAALPLLRSFTCDAVRELLFNFFVEGDFEGLGLSLEDFELGEGARGGGGGAAAGTGGGARGGGNDEGMGAGIGTSGIEGGGGGSEEIEVLGGNVLDLLLAGDEGDFLGFFSGLFGRVLGDDSATGGGNAASA
jgi:hypothetical protein